MDAKRRMEIEWQCVALMREYAYYGDRLLDPGSIDRRVAVFTSDGVIRTPGEVTTGSAEIRASNERLAQRRTPDGVTRHVLLNFFFTHVDEKDARGVVYFMNYSGKANVKASPAAAFYSPTNGWFMTLDMEFKQTPEGWRISVLNTDVTMRSET